MVWAIIFAAVLAFSDVAFADEPELVAIEQEQIDDKEDVQGTPENVTEEDEVEKQDSEKAEDLAVQVTANNILLGELSGKVEKLDEKTEDLETTKELLESIDKRIEGMVESQSVVEESAEPLQMTRDASLTFNAYASANPTGIYANYARQMIAKVGWDENYVFLQDTQASYVFVWGDISLDGDISGSECYWVRWYNAGSGYGWMQQSGVADVTVKPGQYVVLSSLGNYPLLDDGLSLLRNEVGFYAAVSVLLYVLHSIMSFVVRTR